MWRRYTPKTKRFLVVMIRTSQSLSDGNAIGREGCARAAFERKLTNRTTSGPEGAVPNGFSVSRLTTSRPSQTTTSAPDGSLRSNAARNADRGPGVRTTNVPAAPTLTTSYLPSFLARTLGRNVRCPPTFTPRRKTTSERFTARSCAVRGSQVDGAASTTCRTGPVSWRNDWQTASSPSS